MEIIVMERPLKHIFLTGGLMEMDVIAVIVTMILFSAQKNVMTGRKTFSLFQGTGFGFLMGVIMIEML